MTAKKKRDDEGIETGLGVVCLGITLVVSLPSYSRHHDMWYQDVCNRCSPLMVRAAHGTVLERPVRLRSTIGVAGRARR